MVQLATIPSFSTSSRTPAQLFDARVAVGGMRVRNACCACAYTNRSFTKSFGARARFECRQSVQRAGEASQLVVGGRQMDLVAQFRSRAADVDGYARFVRGLVRRHGATTATLKDQRYP